MVIATAVGAKEVNPEVDYFHYKLITKKSIMQQEEFLADILKEKQDLQRLKH